MKLFIDLTSVASSPSGLPLMALNITYKLVERYPENIYHLAFYKKIPEYFKLTFVDDAKVYFHVLKFKKSSLMRIIELPNIIRKINADWNLFFSFAAPVFISGKHCISVVHDLTPWKYPETMTNYAKLSWKIIIFNAIKRSEVLITVSNTVRKEIELEFGRKNVQVIYPGLTLQGIAKKECIDKFRIEPFKYIISVATLEPRKNLSLLVKAYCELRLNKSINEKLVLAGGKGWKIKELEIPEEIRDDVILTGYVNDDDLASLYKYASLFVLPSVYEGFGSPVIEAIASGTKVLLSDIPVFREITNNGAEYFSLNDKDDLKNKIINILKKERTTNDELINFVKRYSWDLYADSINEIVKCRVYNG